MPLPMVHLSVAVLAEKELGIMNRSAYYLGSIAPDGIHMQEHWTGEDKKRSHLGVRGTDDPSGVMEFLTGGVLDTDRDYCIGYALHCLTDLYWNMQVIKEFDSRYGENPSSVLPAKEAYYSDTDQIDIHLYRTMPERDEVWELLQKAQGTDLPGILSAKAVALWNERTLCWYNQERVFSIPITYITLQTVTDFLPKASRYCTKMIQKVLQPDC